MDVAIARAEEAPARQPLRRALLVLVVLALYAFLWPAVTGDMRHFLLPWLDHILAHGPTGAFAIPFSNYTPPYLYLLAIVSPLSAVVPKISLIKLLSLAGTVALAFAVRTLLRKAGKDDPQVMLWLLAIPTVAVNAAGFGQCDAIWSAAGVMAVAAAVSGRNLAMVAWFGIAISFKAQAAFLGPFIALRLVQQRAPLHLWAVPGLVYALAMLPAALAGWPVVKLATVYLNQTQWNPALAGTASNPWSIAEYLGPGSGMNWYWMGVVAAAGVALGYVAAFRRRESDAADLIALALLSACFMPFLLPKMLERFFFLADVLAFTLAYMRQDRRSVLIFLLVESASLLAYLSVMLKAPLLPVMGSVMVLTALIVLIDGFRARRFLTGLDQSILMSSRSAIGSELERASSSTGA